MREPATASSPSQSRFFTCSSPTGAQYITLPLPAALRPLSSHASAPDCDGGSPARRFSSAARVVLPMLFGLPANHLSKPCATSSASSFRRATIERKRTSVRSMSSVGSPAPQPPPPVISRCVPTSPAGFPSCAAPSDSPAAAPRSAPMKRAFSSICPCVMALGCFLRRLGSGRNVPMVRPPPSSVASSAVLAKLPLHEVQPVVPPEAALADEDGGHAEDAAVEGEAGVAAQRLLDLRVLGGGDERLAVEPPRGERALDDAGIGEVVALDPVRIEERVHGDALLADAVGR